MPDARPAAAVPDSAVASRTAALLVTAFVGALAGPARGQAVLQQFDGAAATAYFGSAVASAGDADGDAIADALVGAPTGVALPPPSSYAEVRSSATGAVLRALAPPAFFNSFGTDVAGPGDVNGDGFADFAVGYPAAATVYVFSGADGSTLQAMTPSLVLFSSFGVSSPQPGTWTRTASGTSRSGRRISASSTRPARPRRARGSRGASSTSGATAPA